MSTKKTPAEKRAEERRSYRKLERRLVLLAWMRRQFGHTENQSLLASLKDSAEGYDHSGQSHVVGNLLSRGDQCLIPPANLRTYDSNIRDHLDHINRLRTRPIVLRYFQTLSLLFAERYLDLYHNHRATLLSELNQHVTERNLNTLAGEPEDSKFTESDLHKLAYWMATGSGKTLLFHINYLQFLHYAKASGDTIDNILLVTPNENLSAQHLEELAESDIPCARFSLNESGLNISHPHTVRVIEIQKLVTEKKGSGVSVPVEAFEGSNNLVFVDEGHKGTGSDAETWRSRRQALAATGFTFEYSATFGQALDASKKDAVTDEYSKSILFDYSYRYFYGDGYGKDFSILNLKDYEDTDAVHTLILANLLSFYEQRRYFHENESKIRDYLLEPPLWLQICSTVSATKAETVTVLQFLHRFLANQRNWSIKKIDAILANKSGIETEDNQDVFQGHLPYLRKKRAITGEKIYHDILSRVFQAAQPGALEVMTIKSGSGEVGLRVAGTETYFGLLYIGNVSGFKKVAAAEAPDIEIQEDAISEALFPTVKHASSNINLLIGAKKFMEGWSSWRVSNIGLLNIGVSEGSEIIQLFGRGVRLKGLGFNLKRSASLHGQEHPANIKLLETLNIFAVRANYMATFRDYLEREGIDTGGYVDMDLPLWTNKPFLKEKLYRPRIDHKSSFADECELILAVNKRMNVSHDVTTRINAMQSTAAGGTHELDAQAGHTAKLKNPVLDLLDWQQIHLSLVNYKESHGYHNLTIPCTAARDIISQKDPACCTLIAPDSWASPRDSASLHKLQQAITSLLCKYLERFYQNARQKWESDHMVYEPLTVKDDNFTPYRVTVPLSDPALVKQIHDIIQAAKKVSGKAKAEKLYAGDHFMDLPHLHFDRHLFQPLLISKKGKDIKTTPAGLNAGEQDFVQKLKDYCQTQDLKGRELFLLRNLSRGKGIGFFDNHGFYPDFILWIKKGKQQRIVFIEPHGMMLEQGGPMNDKLQLHKSLRTTSSKALKAAKLQPSDLDAWIISQSPYEQLHRNYYHKPGDFYTREDFAKAHVLFPDDENYLDHIVGAK